MSDFSGLGGRAWRLPGTHPTTIAAFVIDSPGWHPAWRWYMLAAIRLGDVAQYPPAHREFPEATVEISLYALDPKDGMMRVKPDDWPPPSLVGREFVHAFTILTPHNVVVQVAEDDEERIIGLLDKMAAAICERMSDLPLEPSGTRQAMHDQWERTILATLDHGRGHGT